ncbi:MAG: DUF6515 family protein [Bacteroidota bacterium]
MKKNTLYIALFMGLVLIGSDLLAQRNGRQRGNDTPRSDRDRNGTYYEDDRGFEDNFRGQERQNNGNGTYGKKQKRYPQNGYNPRRPRDVRNYAYGRGRNYGYNYGSQRGRAVRYGTYVQRIPSYAVVNSFNGAPFYQCDGVYYQRARRGYVVVRPPVGLRVRNIPFTATEVIINNRRFFKDGPIWYRQARRGRGFIVVQRPI